MFPVYEEKKENLHLHSRIARHESPHLHNSVEFIYLTEGCLELGMGQELFHMEEGDFAVLFPEVIHHCQVFSGENNKACYLWAQPILCGQFASVMQKYCPKNPVIKKPPSFDSTVATATSRLYSPVMASSLSRSWDSSSSVRRSASSRTRENSEAAKS